MLYSVGHSTLTAREFVDRIGGIETVIDVRSHPGSHVVPHFNKAEMARWLYQVGKRYVWMPALGGWVPSDEEMSDEMEEVGVNLQPYMGSKFPRHWIARKRKPTSTNPEWTNQGLYDYSWYMIRDSFLDAAYKMALDYQERDAVFFCAEVLWWKCHRSMISDFLVFIGFDVQHILPNGRMGSHRATIGNRLERYDLRILDAWTQWRNRQSVARGLHILRGTFAIPPESTEDADEIVDWRPSNT